MRVLVCGSRHFNDYAKMKSSLAGLPIDVIIEGEARGADRLAARYGEEHGIPVEKYPADWDKYGKAAGPIRNIQMLEEGKPDYVVAFLAPNSRGTAHMIAQSKLKDLQVEVVNVE